MEKVGIFCGHLEYVTAIWYILRSFGTLVAIWYISPHFGILCLEKSGNPAQEENYFCHRLMWITANVSLAKSEESVTKKFPNFHFSDMSRFFFWGVQIF
jgi:hypothetical protein